MALHVTILGIDGSGKSTVTASLPSLLAAETNGLAIGVGEEFWIAAADEDHAAPGFYPDGLPLSARLSRGWKRLAKRFVDRRSLYPFFKLTQMILQDDAAWRLGARYRADVVVSDGNTLLSAAGRAANYRRPASENRDASTPAPGVKDLEAVFATVLEGKAVPETSAARLPPLGRARRLARLVRALGLRGVWLPDVVVFLDLSPRRAAQRIASRGGKVDRHENLADLTQSRDMYRKTIQAFGRFKLSALTCSIEVDERSPGEVLRDIIAALSPVLRERARGGMASREPLGTPGEDLSGGSVWSKVLSRKYLFGYLIPRWFRGAWREPTFLVSSLGRRFRKEGYSAGIMRAIYDRDKTPYGLWDRCFLEYPLHRAVYDRLQILTREVQGAVEERLRTGGSVRIFTAPSGFAYDLFRPLEGIALGDGAGARQVKIVAADLDPHDTLAEELRLRADRLRIRFHFLKGDMTSDELRERAAALGPYDVALFVGISSWMPKLATARHLSWLRQQLDDDGLLVSDCFTAEAYALSGRFLGYKASYFTPDVYRTLLDYGGFDGVRARVVSGRDRINHVVLAPARARKSALRSHVSSKQSRSIS